ncbi:MAG TPA: YjgP/YjgQ family permease [Epsilonproteobacteria bacterium]|nr:YjgP/YjgQ family permease [Campylobacterota bacterium]HHD79346.1 YjgP/YjgQ family permease [Campylobacterota bacterium]HHH20753.1 YjgP/YjgQ family permease [Nitratifractor sp.]
MNQLSPSLHFRYLAKHYIKNLVSILFGLSFAFASIDYFQHSQALHSFSHKILYIFYMWQEALSLLYPLAIVFALIMTKLSFVKNNTMGAFHAFGYDKKRLFFPLLVVFFCVYGMFMILHTTEFSYAKDKAKLLLKNELGAYDVNDLFFKYNDTFVYIKKLDPVEKKIEDITIFKVEGYQVRYTIHAPSATFTGNEWNAQNATIKTHVYKEGELEKYTSEYKENIKTLKGYKPKIIESLYEGKALNIMDAYSTWKLLAKQHLNSDKIRVAYYDKIFLPLFALALMIILFFKLPSHARMMNLGGNIALSLGATFVIWGVLFGLSKIGANGVLAPELTSIFPIFLLWVYAIYIYITDERKI